MCWLREITGCQPCRLSIFSTAVQTQKNYSQAFRPGLILTRLIFTTETEAAVHIIITQVWDLLVMAKKTFSVQLL